MRITFTKHIDDISKDTSVALVSIEPGKKDDDAYVNQDGRRTIVFAIKDPKGMTRRKVILLARKTIAVAKSKRAERIAVAFFDFSFSKSRVSDVELGQILAEGFFMANYEFTDFRTTPEDGWPSVKEVIVVGATVAAKKGFQKGQIIAEEVNGARTLSNTPGGNMTPAILAKKASEAANGTAIKVTILDEKEMKRLKMGAILGVAQGSSEKPRFIIMEYRGGAKTAKPIVFVGKGVTFDTGGINLKSSEHILGMNMDMSGGAAVIHTVALAAKLKLKKNIIGLVPAVENMPSGSSYRPGDVLRGMSGKTIEIMNTDAEGRVILSDALTYARKYDPVLVVDVATLTGAAAVALGTRASAIFSRNEKLISLTQKLGEESGEYVWPLPLWEEYENDVKGTSGDVTNTHNKGSRYGGAINGAIFLNEFTKDYKCPWMHIDIAPRIEATDDEYLAKGAAGAPVRLLLRLLEVYK